MHLEADHNVGQFHFTFKCAHPEREETLLTLNIVALISSADSSGENRAEKRKYNACKHSSRYIRLLNAANMLKCMNMGVC